MTRKVLQTNWVFLFLVLRASSQTHSWDLAANLSLNCSLYDSSSRIFLSITCGAPGFQYGVTTYSIIFSTQCSWQGARWTYSLNMRHNSFSMFMAWKYRQLSSFLHFLEVEAWNKVSPPRLVSSRSRTSKNSKMSSRHGSGGSSCFI